MQSYPRQQGQSQIVCGGCRTLLMFPQGAQNVRCARCSHITPVPPSVSQDMAQLHCTNPSCRVMLMYPRGALQVQCSLCGTLNDAQQSNQLGHLVCGGCQVTLMYAHGAQSVKCAVCNHITPVPPSRPSVLPPAAAGQHQQYPSMPAGPSPPAGPSAASRQQSVPSGDGANNKLVQAVLVENPPGLDDQGHEVQTIALGVKKENDVG